MQVKARKRDGFRPVDLRLNFENKLQYAVFREIVGKVEAIPNMISTYHAESIRHSSGINASNEDIKACAVSVLHSIHRRLPKPDGTHKG